MTPPDKDAQNSLTDPDGFYQSLVDAHEGLDTEQCLRLDAKLILLMAQCIGDDDLLRELLRAATDSGATA